MINFIRYHFKIMLGCLAGVCVLTLTSLAFSQPSRTQVESAEDSFSYIIGVLAMFENSGRLVNNPGIDGADLEAFIEILNIYRAEFLSGFSAESAMCQFYLDPENARMTLEEKAEIAIGFLADIDQRITRYVTLDQEFREEVEAEFGRFVLEEVQRQKLTAVSSQQLPTSILGEAAAIAFIDSACI